MSTTILSKPNRASVETPVRRKSCRRQGSNGAALALKCATRGEIEFWTLNDEYAGRSRNDEAAFAGPYMLDIWRAAIKPTLLDYHGRCIIASNTNGIDIEQFFWKICNEPEHGFKEY
jgi:hypothetical protein